MMKRTIASLALLGATLAAPAFAQVGVSVSVGQPGFYGRLDIGDYPPPALIYRQPVTVMPVMPGAAPVYLRVPPGHAKNWRKHCHRYDACGVPAYFVTDRWYTREYVPRYESRFGGGYGYGDGYRHERREYRGGDRDGYRRGDWDNDRRGDRDDRGPGHGRGQGNGRGRGPDRD